MTQTQIILLVVVVGALIAVLVARGRGGPRVTEIDRTVRREKEDDR